MTAIGINPDDTFQIYVGISSTIYRSDDGGSNWRITKLPTQQIMNDIIFDPEEPNRVYAGFK